MLKPGRKSGRTAASADDPGRVRGPLQRTTTPSQLPPAPAPARSPCRGPVLEVHPAPARSRRPHQRVRAGCIEAPGQDRWPSSATPQRLLLPTPPDLAAFWAAVLRLLHHPADTERTG